MQQKIRCEAALAYSASGQPDKLNVIPTKDYGEQTDLLLTGYSLTLLTNL